MLIQPVRARWPHPVRPLSMHFRLLISLRAQEELPPSELQHRLVEEQHLQVPHSRGQLHG